MKYVLNDQYNGPFLVSQCGLIFKKDAPVEVKEEKSFELERYISQKFIVPFKQKAADIKKEINKKEKELKKELGDQTIVKPKGMTSESKLSDEELIKSKNKVTSDVQDEPKTVDSKDAIKSK